MDMRAAEAPGRQRSSWDWVALMLLVPPPLFWAGNFIIGRAVRDDIPPMTLLFWRWVIALVCIMPFALKAVMRDLHLYWNQRWRVLSVSVAGVVAFNSFVYIGLQSTTASNALLLNSLIPILIVLLGAVIYRKRLLPLQLFGLLISVAGVLTIIAQGDWRNIYSLSFSQGDLTVFCAMISWACYTLWLRGFASSIDRVGLMAIQILVGLIVLIPFFLWEHSFGVSPFWSTSTISALAYLGVFPSVCAYLLYNMAVVRVGPSRAALSIHLIPVFGVILAVAFLRETVHLYHFFGVSAILTGVLCAVRAENSRRESTA